MLCLPNHTWGHDTGDPVPSALQPVELDPQNRCAGSRRGAWPGEQPLGHGGHPCSRPTQDSPTPTYSQVTPKQAGTGPVLSPQSLAGLGHNMGWPVPVAWFLGHRPTTAAAIPAPTHHTVPLLQALPARPNHRLTEARPRGIQPPHPQHCLQARKRSRGPQGGPSTLRTHPHLPAWSTPVKPTAVPGPHGPSGPGLRGSRGVTEGLRWAQVLSPLRCTCLSRSPPCLQSVAPAPGTPRSRRSCYWWLDPCGVRW